jgi:hypothetical protein
MPVLEIEREASWVRGWPGGPLVPHQCPTSYPQGGH